MGDSKLIRWWRYASIWKLLGTAIGAVVISLICGLFIPEIWNVVCILVVCIIAGILMRKFFPDAMVDFLKEMDR